MKVLCSLLITALIAQSCSSPAQGFPQPDEDDLSDTGNQASGSATLDAVADGLVSMLEPVRQFVQTRVRNRTLGDVANEARNATINVVDRIRDSSIVQYLQENAVTPVSTFFDSLFERVRDRTAEEVGEDVAEYVRRVDKNMAERIREYQSSDER